MYGYRDRTVFCKFHPHKRCEHFCEVHTILLCSICLREKHRGCQIVEDHEFRAFYSKKIRQSINEIETEKNALLGNAGNIAHALDTGLTRLAHYREELDEVINRMSAMKGEVDHQKEEIYKISQSLGDIEKSTTTVTELKHCKQLYASIDDEKEKFLRREQKVLHLPTKFRDEIASSVFRLHKKLKTIRNDITSELNSIHLKQQYGGSPLPKPKEAHIYSNSPYLDIHEKLMSKRSPHVFQTSPDQQGRDSRRSVLERRHADIRYMDKEGRDSRRSLGIADEERFGRESRLQAALKLPHVHFQSTPKPRNLPPINTKSPRHGSVTPGLKFSSYRPPSKPTDIKWTWK